MLVTAGMTNRSNQVDFAKSTFISKSAYKTVFRGQVHNFFLSYDLICVFAVVCENSCKNIKF